MFLFIGISASGQTLTQTYYDKCTGEVKVFTIPLQGSTVIVFYNKSRSFTAADVTSGALQIWLEETYTWWSTYNPCSSAQATQTVVQQTAQQATQAATSAATAAASAAVNIPMPPPPPPPVAAPPPAPAASPPPTSSSSSSSSPPPAKTESKSETKTETKSEEKKEETKQEEKQEEKKEESKEEKKEEEKKEEKKEDKKEEKKKEDKKKQQATQPVLIAANYMTMQNLDGSFNQVASFGLSKSSLTGATSYSANAMIWSNLKQFSLSLSKTDLLFNYDRKVPVKFGDQVVGHTYHKGSIYKITGLSLTAMLMFDTRVLALGMNDVFLLKKGMVFGYALGGTFINMKKDVMMSPSLTAFITRPFPFKRVTLSPMVAASASPVSYTTATNEFTYSEYVTYIVGSNFDFNLTQRFKANLGINTVGNTNKNIPMTYAITIGSKIKL